MKIFDFDNFDDFPFSRGVSVLEHGKRPKNRRLSADLARTRETEQVSEQALAAHGATQCSCLREQRAPSSRGRHGPGSARLTHTTVARMAADDVMVTLTLCDRACSVRFCTYKIIFRYT